MRSPARHLLFAFLLVLAAVSVAGCRSDVSGPASFAAPVELSADYTFKFYVDDGKSQSLVHVVPREVANAAKAKAMATGQITTKTFGNHAMHTLDVHIQSSPPTSGDGPEPIIVTGPDELVMAAATQCGMVGDQSYQISQYARTFQPNDPNFAADFADILRMESLNQNIPKMTPRDLWDPGFTTGGQTTPPNYSLFNFGPTNCDEVLEDEELLVCVADQLAQLADTIAPLTWRSVRFLGPNAGNVPGSDTVAWLIPPPAAQEKFIVRDLALEVLAQIPLLDSYAYTSDFSETSVGESCAAYYANLAPNAPPPSAPNVYPPYDPSTGRSVAQARWAFETNILRAAGQLVHDIVRDSLYDDLSGTAVNTAASSDQVSGRSVGLGLTPTQPYNTLGHAARLLMGRWDDVPGDPDPQCRQPERNGTAMDLTTAVVTTGLPGNGVAELNLVSTLADAGMRARAADSAPLTKSQEVAATLFEEAGLVIADNATLSGTTLHDALLTQLQGIKAQQAQGPMADIMAFSSGPSGLALKALVDSLNGSDYARAAQHNRTTFSIATLSPTTDSTAFAAAAQSAGMTVETTIPNMALSGIGIAIRGGLERALVDTDVIARTGPMMVASQCQERDNDGSSAHQILRLDDTASAANNPGFTGTPLPNGDTTFLPIASQFTRQDVFAVGSAIRSRLVKLREYADVMDNTSKDAQARGAAIAELGAWAGSARAILSTDLGTTATAALPANVYLDIIGEDPADFGVQIDANAGNSWTGHNFVELVVGSPKLAECAAHLATSGCDPTALQQATLLPTDITTDTFLPDNPDASTLRKKYGATGGFFRLVFPVPAGGAVGDGKGQKLGWDETFYVVRTQDPTKPLGTGEVLGALALPVSYNPRNNIGSFGEMSVTLSPMRRELLYDAFALGRWVGVAPPKAGEQPIGELQAPASTVCRGTSSFLSRTISPTTPTPSRTRGATT